MSKNLKKRIYTSLGLFFLLFLIIINNYFLVSVLLIIGIFSLMEFFKMMSLILLKDKKKQYLFNILFVIYIFFINILVVVFSYNVHLKILIFLILLTCIFSDIGGYIFGKIFKGPKLTKISPNKTFSGALGSLLFSSSFLLWANYSLTDNIEIYLIVTGCIISASCQLGDLFFSYLKRKSFLKDTGNFLPGHGGVLDRIDGILLGLPIGVLTLTVLY
ncbi:MAG: phosphatidate cytidylyltransferase [Pelagibacteraceae bacterium]|nr:phosphatidate cytidylyltransferase [Pelagibacteraceae bacterium]